MIKTISLDDLTEQQLKIALLLACGHLEELKQGQSDKTIGKFIGVSHETVGTHLAFAMAKLGCKTRTDFALTVRDLLSQRSNHAIDN